MWPPLVEARGYLKILTSQAKNHQEKIFTPFLQTKNFYMLKLHKPFVRCGADMNMRGVDRRLRKLEKIIGDGGIIDASATMRADGSYDCTCWSPNGEMEIHIATQKEFDAWLGSDPISWIPVTVDDILCRYRYHAGEFLEITEKDDL
jgi:hypothetical protein